jgi:hypothetical protein
VRSFFCKNSEKIFPELPEKRLPASYLKKENAYNLGFVTAIKRDFCSNN